MDYELMIGGTTKRVSIESADAAGREFSVICDDKKFEIEILYGDSEKIIVSIGRKVYLIKVLTSSQTRVLFVANTKIIEALLKQRQAPQQDYSAANSAGGVIKSNFPAKIVKINAGIGDSLSKGETFIVLEAMKMEAQIKAPADCTVSEIFVKEGEIVERGKTLAKLDLQ